MRFSRKPKTQPNPFLSDALAAALVNAAAKHAGHAAELELRRREARREAQASFDRDGLPRYASPSLEGR